MLGGDCLNVGLALTLTLTLTLTLILTLILTHMLGAFHLNQLYIRQSLRIQFEVLTNPRQIIFFAAVIFATTISTELVISFGCR